MDNKKYEDPWECQICGKLFVVPTLARCCEEKHNGKDIGRASDKLKKEN